MAVIASFFTVGGSIHGMSFRSVRIREDITVAGTTTATAKDGEAIYAFNNESSAVAVAVGTTPDAAATAETNATAAGVAIAPGGHAVFFPAAGAKLNAKMI